MRAANAYDVADAVRAVILDRINACERPPILSTYVAAGIVAWDQCCGTLTVAPERVYRTGVFPQEGPDPTGCFDGLLAVDLVVLLVRCVPTLDDAGNAPTAAEQNAAFREVLIDGSIVWNSVVGLADEDTEIAGPAQTFVGAEGGCIASETRFTISVDAETWCPPCPTP